MSTKDTKAAKATKRPTVYANPQGSPYPVWVQREGARGVRLYEACYKAMTTDPEGPHMTPALAHFVIEQHWPDMIKALAPDA